MKDIAPEELKRYDAMTNLLLQPNSRSIGVVRLMDKYYPALAKKVLEGNPTMEKFVMSGFNTMDILMFPMCGHCETLAAFSNEIAMVKKKYVPVARCFKCGKTTVNPTLMKQWCMSEIKKKAPETIADDLMAVVDIIADRMVEKARADLRRTIYAERKLSQLKG